MKYYKKLGSGVVAAQWTGKNLEEMIELLIEIFGTAEYTIIDSVFHYKNGTKADFERSIEIGGYLVKDGGEVFVAGNGYFIAHYEDETTPISQTNKSGSEGRTEFESVVRPVIKYLCQNWNPHATIIITPTNAELVCSEMTTGDIFDYVVD